MGLGIWIDIVQNDHTHTHIGTHTFAVLLSTYTLNVTSPRCALAIRPGRTICITNFATCSHCMGMGKHFTNPISVLACMVSTNACTCASCCRSQVRYRECSATTGPSGPATSQPHCRPTNRNRVDSPAFGRSDDPDATATMEQFSHDLTVALEETSKSGGVRTGCWGVRRRTRSTGNLRECHCSRVRPSGCNYNPPSTLIPCSVRPAADRGQFQQSGRWCAEQPLRRRRRDPQRLGRSAGAEAERTPVVHVRQL